jgi:hypothetical protein
MAMDPVSHTVYLVSADVDPAAPPVAKGKGRPALKPGSFTLLTIAR